MELKNMLIVVHDIDKSVEFYKKLFGLEVVVNNGGNIIMTQGLALQDMEYWQKFTGKNCISRNNMSELYFEEADIEGFVEKLENLAEPVEYVNRLMTHSWGQRVVRFYDPDGNLIEVGTPM